MLYHLAMNDIRGNGIAGHVMVWDCVQVWCCDPSAGRKGPAWKHKAPGASALNWRGRRIKSRLMSSRCVQGGAAEEAWWCSCSFSRNNLSGLGATDLFLYARSDNIAGDIFLRRNFQSCRQLISSRLQPLKPWIHPDLFRRSSPKKDCPLYEQKTKEYLL